MATKNKPIRKKKPETVECGTCDGSGLVKSTIDSYGVIPCKVCEGTGRLEKFTQLSSSNGVA